VIDVPSVSTLNATPVEIGMQRTELQHYAIKSLNASGSAVHLNATTTSKSNNTVGAAGGLWQDQLSLISFEKVVSKEITYFSPTQM